MGCLNEMNQQQQQQHHQNQNDETPTEQSELKFIGNDSYNIINLDDIPLPSTPPPPYSQYIDHNNNFEINSKDQLKPLSPPSPINNNNTKQRKIKNYYTQDKSLIDTITADTIDSFEVLEQTILKQKRLSRAKKSQDMRTKVLLKRTFDLVCTIMDRENGFGEEEEVEKEKTKVDEPIEAAGAAEEEEETNIELELCLDRTHDAELCAKLDLETCKKKNIIINHSSDHDNQINHKHHHHPIISSSQQEKKDIKDIIIGDSGQDLIKIKDHDNDDDETDSNSNTKKSLVKTINLNKISDLAETQFELDEQQQQQQQQESNPIKRRRLSDDDEDEEEEEEDDDVGYNSLYTKNQMESNQIQVHKIKDNNNFIAVRITTRQFNSPSKYMKICH